MMHTHNKSLSFSRDSSCSLFRSGFKNVSEVLDEKKNLYQIQCLLQVCDLAVWGGGFINQAGTLPFTPLAPVFGCEVKAFRIYA